MGARALQRQLMYVPDTARTLPSDAGLADVEEVQLRTPDGERVLAWHAPAKPGQRMLLYFHGNGGSLVTRSDRIKIFRSRGYGVFMITYRGYGGSSGYPSERANVADAVLAYDWLGARGVSADQIVIYGESLGTGVAVQVAAERPSAGIVLDSPYTSMLELAELHYPALPARWFLSDRYESFRYVGKIEAPMLVLHGEQDRIVPVDMARELIGRVTAPKTLVTFPDAGHLDHYLFGSYDTVFDFLESLPAAPDRAGAGAE